MTHLLFLIVLCIIPVLTAYCNSFGEAGMDKFPMRTLSAAGDKLETRDAKVMNELPDLKRHRRILGPFQANAKR